MARPRALLVALLLVAAPLLASAQTPVAYRLSFPDAARHLMDVDVTFAGVPAGPLELRMSRSSPGRYALHEFAKNVFDVRVTDAAGQALTVSRPNPHQWNVTGHSGTVRVTYRVFGDRVDGTYLGIDSSHAHINMPAALMWARGFEDRPASVRFERPPDTPWRVATQLLSGGDAFSFNAPNLQYLMDSPSEFSGFALRSFTVPDEVRTPVFRVAIHSAEANAEVDSLVRDMEAIVRETRHMFREFPAFEGNTYTFIADYGPWATDDAMEHRNSAFLTSQSSIRSGRLDLIDSVAHEFFHAWNVERIRPRSLEPFNFQDVNMSGELWFAEGFTSYYASLIMKRAGLTGVREFASSMGQAIDIVTTSPGRAVRSAVEMSQFAPFVDAAVSIDRTNVSDTYVSYYTWGTAIGLGLDLTLRGRTNGKVTLDDYMRAMWDRFGRPGMHAAGLVGTPYSLDDLKSVLASVSGDAGFATDFFARYIEGREVVDYRTLLGRAGLVLKSGEGRPFTGLPQLRDGPSGVRIVEDVPLGSPAHKAGLARDDEIVSLGGTRVSRAAEVEAITVARKPGDRVPVVFARRGARLSAQLELVENPRIEVVTAEDAGQTLTDDQRRFREQWLSSAGRF